MPSPFLAVRANSGGTAQLYSYSGATPTAIGTAAGGVDSYSTTANSNNRACFFNGYLIYLSANSIQVSRDDGYSWTTAYSFTPVAGYQLFGPMVVTASDGTSYAVILWSITATQVLQMTYSTDGLNWSNTATGVAGRLNWAIPYKNGIAAWDTTNNFRLFSPPSTLSSIAQASIKYLVVWQNNLFALDNVGANLRLGLVSASYTSVATIAATANYANANTYAAWVDPTSGDLIVVSRTNAAGANNWKAWSVATDYTVTERTSTMLTGGLLDSYGTAAKVVGVTVDQIDSVGSDPIISLYIAPTDTSGTPVAQYVYNGVGSLLGDGAGSPNDSGGTVNDSFPNQNIYSLANWTPRLVDSMETEGTPYAGFVGNGSAIVNGIRVQFEAAVPRTFALFTVSASPGSYNLATTPIPSTPIKPGSVAIHGTISGTVEVALDDGAGAFPTSTLLPSGGTIDYATGAMTGTTATLDASTDVRAYWSGGTASVQFFRTLATDSYPADEITNAVNPAPLSNPTQGTISGVTNINVPADGTVCQVDIDMTGFSSGNVVSIEPYIF